MAPFDSRAGDTRRMNIPARRKYPGLIRYLIPMRSIVTLSRSTSALACCLVMAAFAPTSTLRAQTTADQPGAPDSRTAEETASATTIGGYGEIQYVEPEGSAKGTLDVPRFILFLEHAFDDNISFFSELEVEHVKIEGGEEGGEVALEQAYVQYRFSDRVNIRTGLMVLPIGIINEYHEPSTFNGVRRPFFDRVVVPSTWREIGIGLAGRIPEAGLQYRAMLTSGLNAAGFGGSNGLRGGRLEGAEASMQSLAISGRLEYLDGGLRAGGWAYYGGSAFGNSAIAEGLFGAPVAMYGLDAQFNTGDLYLRGVIAGTSIGDADKINDAYHAVRDTATSAIIGYDNPIGSAIGGGYIEVAYNVAQLLSKGTSHQLLPFVRYEKFNTHAGVVGGVTADKALDRSYIVAGLTYKPIYNMVYKLDWTSADDATDAKLKGAFSLGVGYNF